MDNKLAPDTDPFFSLYNKDKTPVETKAFVKLPNGRYKASRTIRIDTVKNSESLNYGKTKIVIELKVLSGEQAGKTAYFHHVLVPHELEPPPDTASSEAKQEWVGKMTLHTKKTQKILHAAGVDTEASSIDDLARNIGHSNVKTIVTDFTMKEGIPYLNESEVTGSAELPDLWDTAPGDNAPLS